mgnify:FL=1
MPKCPICGLELMEVGYPDEIGYQQYRCPNDCKFTAPLSWKIWNAVFMTSWLIVMFIMLLFIIPIWAMSYIAGRIKGLVWRCL